MLGYIVLAAIIGLIPAAIAQGKGRSFITWWIFGTLLWIVAMPCALMLKPTANVETERLCPFCRSIIPREATVCRYCQRESSLTEPVPEPQPKCGDEHNWTQSELYPDWLKCANPGCNEMRLVGRQNINAAK